MIRKDETVMDEWNNFLEANRQQIQELGDISPTILLLKSNTQPTVCLLEGFKSGDTITGAIKRIIRETNPDSYIFSCLGWATEFAEKVFGSPKYEHVVDMPLDDREEVYVQIEVLKSGLVGRSYMATVNRNADNIFIDESSNSITKSKFILNW